MCNFFMVYILQLIFHTTVFIHTYACQVFSIQIIILAYHPPNSAEGLDFSAFHLKMYIQIIARGRELSARVLTNA